MSGADIVLLRPPQPGAGGDRHTIAGILEWYRDGPLLLRKQVKRTRQQYRSLCTRMIGLVADGHLPPVPTAVDWRLLQTHLLAEGLAPATINWCYRVTRLLIEEAAGDTLHGVRLAGELKACRPLEVPDRPPRAPPMDAVARIIESGCLRHRGERAWCLLLWEAGLRRDEALGLWPSDLERHRGKLTISRQRSRDVRKRGDWHVVYLRAPVAADLAWAIDHCVEMKARSGPRRQQEDLSRYIFPWSHRYLDGLGRRIREALGRDVDAYFPRGTMWHGFRHGGATQIARRPGATAWDVQRYLGDRSLEMAACYAKAAGGDAARGELFAGSMHDSVITTSSDADSPTPVKG